jgi:hypothetical protein
MMLPPFLTSFLEGEGATLRYLCQLVVAGGLAPLSRAAYLHTLLLLIMSCVCRVLQGSARAKGPSWRVARRC